MALRIQSVPLDFHPGNLSLRRARLSDLGEIHQLISYWAARGRMLVRSEALLAETIRDFFVLEDQLAPGEDRLAGVVGLHLLGPDLGEVRGLAVHPEYQRRGLGRWLVLACEREARDLALPSLFAWTYEQRFFEACGFERIDKSHLHPRVWSECQRCPFFENCQEIPMRKVVAPGD
jgi:amino-acid N-acetyltransferase